MSQCTKQRMTPCKHCPWKKSSRQGGADIPNFDIELMRGLQTTVGPRGSHQDSLYSIMACHDSPVGKESPCAGYIAVEGVHNINVRLAIAKGEMKPLYKEEIEKEIGEELYDNFYEMLDDYEAALASSK